MRFYSKLVFLLNVCFIITVFIRLVVLQMEKGREGVLGFQPVESTIAVLGYFAIFFNIFFVILFLFRYSKHKLNGISKIIVFFNCIMLPAQFFFHFFS